MAQAIVRYRLKDAQLAVFDSLISEELAVRLGHRA